MRRLSWDEQSGSPACRSGAPRQNMRRMLCSVVFGATGGPETDLRRTLDAAWAVRDACDAG